MNRYHLTVTDGQSAILTAALDIYVNLRLGQWGHVLNHAPKMMFDVPEGAPPMGNYPITDIPSAKVDQFRDHLTRLGSEYICAEPGITFNLRSEGVGRNAKLADALGTRLWGLTEIEVSTEEAYILVQALDLYSRLRIGQWGDVINHGPEVQFDVPDAGPPPSTGKDPVMHLPPGKCATYRTILKNIGAAFINFVPTGSFGIHSDAVEDNARVAYDMQQVLRHRLAWDREPKGGMIIDFDTPWMTSTKKVPLATVTRTEG